MKLTWTEIAKKWSVFNEMKPTNPLDIDKIEQMEKLDKDYLCILKGKNGSICRKTNDGSEFHVYLETKISESKIAPHSLSSKRGTKERQFVIPADKLDKVARIMKCLKPIVSLSKVSGKAKGRFSSVR